MEDYEEEEAVRQKQQPTNRQKTKNQKIHTHTHTHRQPLSTQRNAPQACALTTIQTSRVPRSPARSHAEKQTAATESKKCWSCRSDRRATASFLPRIFQSWTSFTSPLLYLFPV